ncbi:MAG: hypothetical protein ACJ762_05840 [Solirubrobacteraceae bacterium]
MRSVAASFAVLLVVAASALAQTPTAPANGEKVTTSDVVVRWTLEPGWNTLCVEWSARPETSFAGGPFLAPLATKCDVDARDVAYLIQDLDFGRYYWHVEGDHQVCDGPDSDPCHDVSEFGPTSNFEVVAPPPPPAPKTCSPAAADYVGEGILIPYAEKHYRRYYHRITSGWTRRGPVCKDLDGDGVREMVVRMVCCPGGALSPWAIFKHDSNGNWRIAYAQIRDTVLALAVRGRVVRVEIPAPYTGACTRNVRYRLVARHGSRFTSRLTARRHLRHC